MKIKTLRFVAKVRKKRHSILSAIAVVVLFSVYQNCGTKATTTVGSTTTSGTTTASTSTTTSSLAIISPAAYTFTSATNSNNAIFTVTNTSTQILTNISTTLDFSSGGFTLVSDGCNGMSTLSSGGSCLIKVNYSNTTSTAALSGYVYVNYQSVLGVAQSALLGVLSGPASGTTSTSTSSISTASAGAVIPVYKNYKPGFADHLFTLSATEGPNAGYTFNGIAFYAFSSNQIAGTRAVYRCYITNAGKSNRQGKHFISIEPQCEGATNEGALGYVYTASTSGGLLLNRYYANGDYVSTTNTAEAPGYTLEGPQGYVPNSLGGTSGTTPGSVGSGRYICDALYGTILFRNLSDDMSYAKYTGISRCNSYSGNAAECTSRSYCKDTTTGSLYY